MKRTTLVLGAGASRCMGYPTGDKLRQSILQLQDDQKELAAYAGLFDPPGQLATFITAFQRSQMDSIDAFLARRPEFSDIGKRAIAAILLNCENAMRLYGDEVEDHWYRYFFKHIAHESWDQLDLSTLRVITFNYDRSFEHYLLSALMHAYNRSEEEAITKLRGLNIVHVYGSLGAVLPGEPDYLIYGAGRRSEHVQIAARKLKVIPEGRNDDETLQRARAFLVASQSIAFLGFGFDETNLDRLDTKNTCAGLVDNCTRKIVATCMGMTSAEALKASVSVGGEGNALDPEGCPPGFYRTDCTTMLRRSLILG